MSRFDGYKPNERIVDRAVALWLEMLGAPKYDNLGPNSPESPDSKFVNSFASVMAAALPKNNTADVLDRFGVALRDILMNGHEWKFDDRKYFELPSYLHVDYGPDQHLSAASERAGLKMQFPWKTTMFLTSTHLYVGNGYAAPFVYHYPLSGDRWLVTTLHGDDIAKVIALVEAGELTTELTRP